MKLGNLSFRPEKLSQNPRTLLTGLALLPPGFPTLYSSVSMEIVSGFIKNNPSVNNVLRCVPNRIFVQYFVPFCRVSNVFTLNIPTKRSEFLDDWGEKSVEFWTLHAVNNHSFVGALCTSGRRGAVLAGQGTSFGTLLQTLSQSQW